MRLLLFVVVIIAPLAEVAGLFGGPMAGLGAGVMGMGVLLLVYGPLSLADMHRPRAVSTGWSFG
jgi:hypothetical protein